MALVIVRRLRKIKKHELNLTAPSAFSLKTFNLNKNMSEETLKIAGFKAAAVRSGIRGKDRLDLGLIYCVEPVAAAGVFTTSLVKAAPVLLDMARLKKNGRCQAILVNSGIANACTGAEGMDLALATAAMAAKKLEIDAELILVASTGVIGAPLDISCFENGMTPLVAGLKDNGFFDVARAMMTTDTVPKAAVRTVQINGKKIKIAGLAKGSGMIMPNMATMLAFIMTDAVIPAPVLQNLLGKSVEQSFNSVTVDGDTSTNDSVIIMASGKAGNETLDGHDEGALALFKGALDDLTRDLAMKIAGDGEGATKLVTINVIGARTDAEADQAARCVANSALVKTAFFGEDANWGRIIAALGRCGASFDPEVVDIAFDGVLMVKDGVGLGEEVEKKATKVLQQSKFQLNIDLKAGPCARTIYTCDLSVDYVKINADYRT